MATKLGNHISTQKGFAFKSNWYQDTGMPIVKVSDFTNDAIDTTNLTCIPKEIGDIYQKYALHTDDVVIQTVGSWPNNPQSVVGKAIKVPKDANGALLNQNAVRLDPENGLDRKFLFYLLRNDHFKSYIVGCAQGAASQASITLEAIRGYKFELLSLSVQRKIAAMLSAYDDLIEVNTRRIRALEEMAGAVYREWFGSLDVGSLPEGWEVKTFTDVCNEIIDGDWIETKDQGGEDYRLLQVSNIGLGDFVETGNFRYITQETFERLNCQEVVPGDILVSRMPTPIGRGWLVTKMPWRMITAVDVAIVRPNPELLNPFYCIHWLNSPETLARSEMNASGTTRPRITRRVLSGFDLVVPPIELQNEFGKITGDMYEMQTVLRRKNANLRRTRDLLLPRLVSGEVGVEAVHE